MAFVVSDGKITALERTSMPAVSRVALSADFAVDYAEIYRTQPHVRTVIGFLARNIAQIGLHVFERVSDTDRRRLADHPLAQLIAKPNPTTTRYRLIDALVNDLGIYDVACWAKVKSAAVPAGLLRLPPSQITPLGENWAWPEGVKFAGTRGSVELTRDQIVLFRGYNPTDARWGLSPMETLRQVLAEEYQATLYREQLWRNGARFPGHIERPAGVTWTTEQRERFRGDWRGLYTGTGPGAGGTPVLEDGMKFVAGGITPAQAQYLETRKLTREEVASAFHIPLPMVGILDHATFSNIEEQHKNLYQDTLGPWLEMIQQELGLQLVPDFDTTGKVYVEFNLADKLKGSFEEQAASLQTAVGAPWLTRNEARARQNLPQIPGGDALVTPLNVLEGGQASPTDSAPKAARRLVREMAAGPVRVKARAPQTFEARYADVVGKFFRRQGAVVRSNLGIKAAVDFWDGERWDRELTDDLYRVSALVSDHVAEQTMKALGYEPDAFDADRTRAWLREVAARSASSINQATKAQLDAAVAGDDLTAGVGSVFTVAEGQRAGAIAASGVTLLSSFATVESTRQAAGEQATKTWVTGPNARPEHAALDGETVALSEDFSNGAAWPPGDEPGCNCELEITVA